MKGIVPLVPCARISVFLDSQISHLLKNLLLDNGYVKRIVVGKMTGEWE